MTQPIPHTCPPAKWCGLCAFSAPAGRARKPLPVCPRLDARVLHAGNTPDLRGLSRSWRRCTAGYGSTAPDARRGLVCACPTPDPGGLLWRLGAECGPACPGYPTPEPGEPTQE